MIAGPYRFGAETAEAEAANLRVLNEAAYAVFQKGYLPVIGANMALPVIEVAGEAAYDALMMPISLALAERCDAIMRIGGASDGADSEVAWFAERGLAVYCAVTDVQDCRGRA